MNFITKNLDEIISLFLAEKATNQNDIISDEIIQALNFLLEGTTDNYHSILPFNILIKQPSVQSKMVSCLFWYRLANCPLLQFFFSRMKEKSMPKL